MKINFNDYNWEEEEFPKQEKIKKKKPTLTEDELNRKKKLKKPKKNKDGLDVLF